MLEVIDYMIRYCWLMRFIVISLIQYHTICPNFHQQHFVHYHMGQQLKDSSISRHQPLSHCSFPDCLKFGKSIPVHKAGNRFLIDNDRPITTLLHVNKIFETALSEQITRYVEQNNLIYPGQFGFQSGFSTSHCSVDFLNSIVCQ